MKNYEHETACPVLSYIKMREVLNERIPEILDMPEYTDLIEFWGSDEIPMYCYYELLEILILQLLKKEINDDHLYERIIVFMEDMASSEDTDVQTLLQVQILEAFFGLDYHTFLFMEKSLLPKTKVLLDSARQYFNGPSSL